MMAANSPGWKPKAFRPAVTLRTSSRYWLQVRPCQVPDASCHLSASKSGNEAHVCSKFVRIVFPRAARSISARSAFMSGTMLGNTLLAGGGASLIYVRSPRSTVTFCIAGVAWAVVFGALAVGAFTLPDGAGAVVALCDSVRGER